MKRSAELRETPIARVKARRDSVNISAEPRDASIKIEDKRPKRTLFPMLPVSRMFKC